MIWRVGAYSIRMLRIHVTLRSEADQVIRAIELDRYFTWSDPYMVELDREFIGGKLSTPNDLDLLKGNLHALAVKLNKIEQKNGSFLPPELIKRNLGSGIISRYSLKQEENYAPKNT